MSLPTDMEALYTEARQALKRKEYDRAAALLKQILLVDENYKDASSLLAQAVRLKRRRWYNDARVWGLLGALILIGAGIWLGPRLLAGIASRGAVPASPTAPTRMPAPILTPLPSPTVIPLDWKRVSVGNEFARDEVLAIAVDPGDPEIIYVGTLHAGIYKSIDGGLSWRPSHNGLMDAHVQSIVIDPNDTRILYASVASNRVYKTVNGGQDWLLASDGIQGWDYEESGRLLMSPDDSATLYFASMGGVFKTTNGGSNWWQIFSQCKIQGEGGEGVEGMVISPADANVLIVGYPGNVVCPAGLYISKDAGQNWELLHAFPEDQPVPANLGIDNLQGNYLYSRNSAADHTNLIYGSSNGGQDFQRYVVSCAFFAVHPADGRIVYCGRDDGKLYRTENAGQDWAFLSDPGIGWIRMLAFVPGQPEKIFAGGNGLAYSADGGLTWERRVNGLAGALITLKIQSDTHFLFVTQWTNSFGMGYFNKMSVFRSDDHGENWRLFFPNDCRLELAPAGKLYCWSWDPAMSVDGGATWQPLVASGVNNAFANPYRPDDIYSVASWNAGIARSTDGALTWETVTEEQGIDAIGAFFFAADRDLVYFVSTHPGFLRKSTDGREWNLCGTVSYEWLSPLETRAVIDPRDGGRIYAATRGAGVALSEDECATWSPRSLGLVSLYVNSLAINPTNPDTIYAGTDGGAYVSYNGGAAWGQVNDGLLGATVVYSIAVDDSGTVYASTPYGIFRLEGK